MATKIPLVLGADGNIQQLQTGDSIVIATANTDVVTMTNGEATAAVIGAPVYVSSADTFMRAQANASASSKAWGMVYDSPNIANGASGSVATDGIVTATTTQWDAVTGQSGGLTPGSDYFLSAATEGQMTTTPPSTVGQYVVKLGKALSSTKFDLSVDSPILL